MSNITNIPDAVKQIVIEMQIDGYDINYQFGHPKEVQQTLMEQTQDIVTRNQRYPLLTLFLDFTEGIAQSDKDYISEAEVSIVIVNETDRNYKAAERLEHSFKAVLWPLYKVFILKCEMSPLFDVDAKFRIPHNKRDHYFYSADDAKDQNVFAAYLDAVEITNMDLKLQDTGCDVEYPEYVYHNGILVTHENEAVTWQN